jgi:2-amino-4-hydroxy-6-hydroxymethyldihydropteridine diphosphokinase
MIAVVGLGSNVGDRLAILREAKARIAGIATVLATSQVYETAPVGGPPQGSFLNAALRVQYMLSPIALLDELQRIEHELGRVRDVRWGPRTIDLDVLWIDGLTVDEERLVVPHPRLSERAFALAPLLDVAPEAPYAHPRDPSVLAIAAL